MTRWWVNTPDAKMSKSIRSMVEGKIEENIYQLLTKSHETNYMTWYVESDGTMWWSEEVDQWTYSARDGKQIPSVARVGTGSIACNCDWCRDGETMTERDYDGDAVDYAVAEACKQLGGIPHGYFDDESAK